LHPGQQRRALAITVVKTLRFAVFGRVFIFQTALRSYAVIDHK